MGITETLKFSADMKGREFTKGRFNVSLAIVDQYKEPENGTYFDKQIGEPVIADSMVHLMPVEYDDFIWRLRIDLRCLIDAPMNTNTDAWMPSCYVEFGWS